MSTIFGHKAGLSRLSEAEVERGGGRRLIQPYLDNSLSTGSYTSDQEEEEEENRQQQQLQHHHNNTINIKVRYILYLNNHFEPVSFKKEFHFCETGFFCGDFQSKKFL